jgi:hypothetical protein
VVVIAFVEEGSMPRLDGLLVAFSALLATSAAVGSSGTESPRSGAAKVDRTPFVEPGGPRGFQDCDGNGVDDAIDLDTDFANRTVDVFPDSECYRFRVTTVGSDFDTEVAFFDEQGNLIATNDDIAPGNLQSELNIYLEPGTYFAAIGGFNTQFTDGFGVSFNGCPASGELRWFFGNSRDYLDGPTLTLAPGRTAWLEFEIRALEPGLSSDDANNDGRCDNEFVDQDIATRRDVGTVSRPGEQISFQTTDSNFSNAILLYRADGAFLEWGASSGNSTMLNEPLPEGDYLVGVLPQFVGLAGYGPEVGFGQDLLNGGTGSATFTISSPTRSLSYAVSLTTYRSRWFEFSVRPDTGPDCDWDGVLDADELDCNGDGTPDACQVLDNLALGGPAGTSDVPIAINTFGSDFDTEIAVWDAATGVLIDANDDAVPGVNLQSEIVRTYEPGEYLLAISGFNTFFFDFTTDLQFGGIEVNANGNCAAGGSATVTIGENTGSGIGVGSGRVQLVPFTVAPPPPPCNAADLASPFGVLDLADVNTFAAGFLAMDPVADLTGDGLFDLGDIGLLVGAFVAGCP